MASDAALSTPKAGAAAATCADSCCSPGSFLPMPLLPALNANPAESSPSDSDATNPPSSLVNNKKPSSKNNLANVIHVTFKSFLGTNDKKNCEYVLNNAPQTEPVGWKHAEAVAKQFNDELKGVLTIKDWTNAKLIKPKRGNWQAAADKEKTLLEKCQWAQGHAEEKVVYFSKREDFDKCQYYQNVSLEG